MQLTDSLKNLLKETATQLKGAARRRFQAQTVLGLGYGGQLLAQEELEWDRNTIRKGIKELTNGITCVDNMSAKGRYKAEEHLPSLLEDIKKLVDSQSQTDPSFKSQRLYTRLTASQVRKLLIEKFGYNDQQLPTEETIRIKLNYLGYRLKRVAKVLPQKKFPETDAIFERLAIVNQSATDDKSVLRLSLDAKARINIGSFDRGGRNRLTIKTDDHDYNSKTTIAPYGIFLPELDELFLYFTESKVTSDFIVDVLADFWKSESWRFPDIKTLIFNQDNGGENNSRRTQFMKRIVEFAHEYKLNIRLAYYPPYHSKYNPIERTWGILEKSWNGSILDEVETALNFAQNMTWKGKHPVVKLVSQTYETGVKLTKEAMSVIEQQIERLTNSTHEKFPNLGKWFIDICCETT
ncbi:MULTISPECIES: ISAzo13 family transposase [unclassified Nostoc]|uniref:ISAzo13 family transposase n=1 Tax=unclassified Nostoc TaxID=2593658 RepID=UPI00261626B4|nr:ISAzo13 family transposase [Nostoc sp. S13]MDF5737799.1 ISAzo13 family transposase [Nostoc sp. S13]